MPEPSMKDRLTGGGSGVSTGRTVIKLVIASIIVGAVFSFFRIGVREFWSGVFHNVSDLIGSLGESFGEIALTLGTYLLIGAGVVIPIWLISRLLSSRK